MNDRILVLEIELLVARCGERRVIEALATASHQSLDAIEREIKAVKEKKHAPRSRRIATTEELVARACSKSPELHPDVMALARRHEDRAFLPQLRQVERFLDHANVPHAKLKSRKAALPKVVAALASMTKPQIGSLLQTDAGSGESAFSLLANEIMGKQVKR